MIPLPSSLLISSTQPKFLVTTNDVMVRRHISLLCMEIRLAWFGFPLCLAPSPRQLYLLLHQHKLSDSSSLQSFLNLVWISTKSGFNNCWFVYRFLPGMASSYCRKGCGANNEIILKERWWNLLISAQPRKFITCKGYPHLQSIFNISLLPKTLCVGWWFTLWLWCRRPRRRLRWCKRNKKRADVIRRKA